MPKTPRPVPAATIEIDCSACPALADMSLKELTEILTEAVVDGRERRAGDHGQPAASVGR